MCVTMPLRWIALKVEATVLPDHITRLQVSIWCSPRQAFDLFIAQRNNFVCNYGDVIYCAVNALSTSVWLLLFSTMLVVDLTYLLCWLCFVWATALSTWQGKACYADCMAVFLVPTQDSRILFYWFCQNDVVVKCKACRCGRSKKSSGEQHPMHVQIGMNCQSPCTETCVALQEMQARELSSTVLCMPSA